VQLRGEPGDHTRWMRLDELISRKCHLTTPEYTALTSWLPALTASRVREESDNLEALAAVEASSICRRHEDECEQPSKRRCYDRMPLTKTRAETTAPLQCPKCIGGQIVTTLQYNQLVLRYSPPADLPETVVSKISDQQLLAYLCHGRAVLPYPCNNNDTLMVECLMPLRTIVSPYPFKQEYMIARLLAEEDTTPLTVLQVALVRDCLIGADRERLRDACARPCWTVAQDEFYAGHYFTCSRECGAAPSWKLQPTDSSGQLELTGLVRYITKRRQVRAPRQAVTLHPWQAEPPLPSRVTIDISHHLPRSLQAPEGWEILQRNGRVWITERSNGVVRLDAAHYGMLLAAGCDQAEQVPTTEFLVKLSESCRTQQDADRRHFIHWSRHLLVNIKQITGAELLIGASAVMFNPHFLHFVSPHRPDVHLGAVEAWPQVPALLVLDSFAPQLRGQMLAQAAAHCPGVWVLWQHKNPDDPSLATLRRTATLYAELPKKSRVLHKPECWETAAWDVEQSRSITQVWRLNTDPKLVHYGPVPNPAIVQHHLGGGGHHRYAFHWSTDPVPPRLLLHRQNQQDSLRHTWDGLVAGTDGSVDVRAERMGAAYVLGADPDPIAIFFARVGGPLASARAEAASLLQILRDVKGKYGRHVHLLIFVDCLVILDILRKWGRSEFHPDPKEIIHFTVIYPLIEELRQWTGNITLLKVKSHTGCLLNERADELAERGCAAEGPEICPGPQKYGSLWLRVRPEIRRFATECGKTLPRDSAPNRSILEKVAGSNVLRAVRKRTTVFVSDLFDREEGSTVSRVIGRCAPSEYRIWLKCMTGIYPVQAYLKRIGKAQSPNCPHCGSGAIESLTHFACVCPKFREARTSAHNKVRNVITSFLDSTLDTDWTLFEETRMANTGLMLRPTPQFTAEQWGRRQPDWVLVSQQRKRIAIVDLCRPSDVHPAQLLTAAIRKQQTYLPLLDALSHYSEQGWTIHVFPWAVGIRGMIKPMHVHSLMKFAGIHHKHWTTAVESTVLASVKAFHFLHRVRFGGLPETVRSDPDPDHNDSDIDNEEKMKRPERLPRSTTQECAAESVETPCTHKRAYRFLADQAANARTVRVAALPSTPKDTGRPIPSTCPSLIGSARNNRRTACARRTNFKEITVEADTMVWANPPGAPVLRTEPFRSNGRRRPTLARWKRSTITRVAESNLNNLDTEPQTTEPVEPTTPKLSLTVLWTRWRQAEPRRDGGPIDGEAALRHRPIFKRKPRGGRE
jgi:ribonuclease HI